MNWECKQNLNVCIVQRLADWQESAEHEEAAVRNMGYREGKEESKIEIAKKMKEKNIDISTIVELTGLTEEQIKVI